LREYLEDEWLPHLETQVKPSTFRSVATHVRLDIGPALGDTPVERLTREDIMDFYARLLHKPATNRDRPLSKSSIQRIHATVHWSLENLVLAGRLSANPAHGLRKRRRKWENYEFLIWTPRELDRFLSRVEADPLFPMWRLLAWTGMRRGEALALKWADFRTDTRTMTIRRAISLVGAQAFVSTPKSAQARAVDLDRETIAILRRHRASQTRARRTEGLPPAGSLDWIFPTANGGVLNPAFVSKRFKQLVREHRMPEIRLHDLRHTHASHLLLAGANIKAVQERLGHADIVLTLNTYSHLLPTTQRDSLNALSRFHSKRQ
jgi:integrase